MKFNRYQRHIYRHMNKEGIFDIIENRYLTHEEVNQLEAQFNANAKFIDELLK